MISLKLKIPPALFLALTAAGMWGISILFPPGQISLPGKAWFAMLFGLFGLFFPMLAVLAFHRADTTVDPRYPEHSKQLVIVGIYNLSRNPMYLGFLLLLTAWAIYLGNWLAGLLLPLFVIYLNRFQITPEERVLFKKFGTPYQQYLSRVRRWI